MYSQEGPSEKFYRFLFTYVLFGILLMILATAINIYVNLESTPCEHGSSELNSSFNRNCRSTREIPGGTRGEQPI